MYIRLLAAILLACSCPAVAQDWVELRSPHYTIVTDAGAARASDVALRFERLRSAFGSLVGVRAVHLPVPLEIVAFRNSQEFMTYAPRTSGGSLQPGEHRSYLLLDLSAEDKWPGAYRSYAEQLLAGTLPETAPWFDDGLAAYLSAFRVNGNSVEFRGLPIAIVPGMKRPALTDLLAVNEARPGEESSSAQRQRYALQSSLLVSYLIDTDRLSAAVSYFQLVHSGMSSSAAIRKAFDSEPAQLDAEFASYLVSSQARVVPAAVEATKFQAKPLDPIAVRVQLAQLRIGANDLSDKTVQEFTDILALRPDDVVAQRDLGYLYFLRGEFDSAALHLDRALASAPSDPWANFYRALVTVRRSLATRRPPGNVPQLKQQLQIATAIPDLSDVYSLLSFADLVQHDTQTAVADARKAAERSPRSETDALNLARAYLASDQPVPARDILRRLKDSPNLATSVPAKQDFARAERAADSQATTARHKIPETYDNPKWHRSEEEIEREPEKPVEKPADKRPVKYLEGELLSVDCSQAPAATLRVQSGGRTWKMLTADSKQLVLLGADEFSCSWRNRRVLVNYKAGGKADGDLVSLEVR